METKKSKCKKCDNPNCEKTCAGHRYDGGLTWFNSPKPKEEVVSKCCGANKIRVRDYHFTFSDESANGYLCSECGNPFESKEVCTHLDKISECAECGAEFLLVPVEEKCCRMCIVGQISNKPYCMNKSCPCHKEEVEGNTYDIGKDGATKLRPIVDMTKEESYPPGIMPLPKVEEELEEPGVNYTPVSKEEVGEKRIGVCRQCQLEENTGVCDRSDCANFTPPIEVKEGSKDIEWTDVELADEGTPMAQFQKDRTDFVSEMLDEAPTNRIFSTSRLYSKLDKSVSQLLSQQEAKIREGERSKNAKSCIKHCDKAREVAWEECEAKIKRELVEKIEKELPNYLHKYGCFIMIEENPEPLERKAKKNQLTKEFIKLLSE